MNIFTEASSSLLVFNGWKTYCTNLLIFVYCYNVLLFACWLLLAGAVQCWLVRAGLDRQSWPELKRLYTHHIDADMPTSWGTCMWLRSMHRKHMVDYILSVVRGRWLIHLWECDDVLMSSSVTWSYHVRAMMPCHLTLCDQCVWSNYASRRASQTVEIRVLL